MRLKGHRYDDVYGARRMRVQIGGQEREIEMLCGAGVGTAAAELLLVRMWAKVAWAEFGIYAILRI